MFAKHVLKSVLDMSMIIAKNAPRLATAVLIIALKC